MARKSITPKTISTAERTAEALRLRSQRLSYQEIAIRVGYHDSTAAYTAIHKALADHVLEEVELLRAEEAASLDSLEAECWRRLYDPRYAKSMLFAVDRIIAIKERRAKMLGIDQQQATIAGPQIIIEEAPHGYLGITVDSTPQAALQAPGSTYDTDVSTSSSRPPHGGEKNEHEGLHPPQDQLDFFDLPVKQELTEVPDNPELVVPRDYFGELSAEDLIIPESDFDRLRKKRTIENFPRSGTLLPENPEEEGKPVQVGPTGRYEGMQRYPNGRLKRFYRKSNGVSMEELEPIYAPITDQAFLNDFNEVIPERHVRKGPRVRKGPKGNALGPREKKTESNDTH